MKKPLLFAALLILTAGALQAQTRYITVYEVSSTGALIGRLAKLDTSAGSLTISAPDAAGLVTIRSAGYTQALTNYLIDQAEKRLTAKFTQMLDAVKPQQEPALRLVGGPSGAVSVNYDVTPPEVDVNVEVLRNYLSEPVAANAARRALSQARRRASMRSGQ